MNSFLTYLKKADPSIYQSLAHYGAGTSNFDATWKALAQNYGSRFDSLQHNYIQGAYYTPAANNLKSASGIDLSKRSSALQNVVWSVSVQHGTGGAARMFKNAGITNGMSDATIIKKIYAERSNTARYFPSSSTAIRNSVANRFKSELNDALRMLG
jgi:hypothetical protein